MGLSSFWNDPILYLKLFFPLDEFWWTFDRLFSYLATSYHNLSGMSRIF